MTENQNQPFVALAPVIPEILSQKIKIKNQDWTIQFYEEFEKTIFSDQDFLEKSLTPFARTEFRAHRVQQIIDGTPILFGIFPEEKLIGVYSPRLGRELYLIEQIQLNKDQEPCLSLVLDAKYIAFKNYAEKVASLPLKDFPSIHDVVTKKYDLPDLINDPFYQELEVDIANKTGQLVHFLKEYKASPFEKVSDFGLDLTARFALMRIHLLKFLAILPSLDHDKLGVEVKRILLETFRRLLIDSTKAKLLRKKGQEAPLPTYVMVGLRVGLFIGNLIPASQLASLVRASVRLMATRFIAGENIESVESSFKGLFSTKRDVTLDQLGELVVSEKEADNYCREVINLIEGFGQHVKKGDQNKAGINRAHVSIKVSALCSDFKPHALEYTYKLVAPRLKEILIKAKEKDVFINIDAEHYDYRDIVFKVYSRVLLETEELRDFQQTGIVLQAYLRDAYDHLLDIVELAKTRGLRMPIRIVKGAYWDAETVEADAHSFDAPEFLNKEETDLNFRQLIVKMFEFDPHVQLCLASHNFADHCFAEVLREKKFSHIPVIEHQCLHMTYEALSMGLAKMGWPTRNYVPVGSLLVGMAYLVRRIMENSSQVGVLTIMRSHNKRDRLESPMAVHLRQKEEWTLKHDTTVAHMTSEFFNITPIRLYLNEQWNIVNRTYTKFREDLLKQSGVVEKDNNFLTNGEELTIHSSSQPDLLVGKIRLANAADVDRAVSMAEQSYNKGNWSRQFWLTRSSVLLKAADIMLCRRNELSALITYEAGKSIAEAYGDVDEAIDFLNYYAREERKITVHSDSMVSRGPIVAITPWNFPIAIPTGMVAGPLVAGNTVILKSAEQTPLIAQEMVNILHEAGVPKDALIHLPGLGEDVGAALVKHPGVAGYVFTGSKTVGQLIAHTAGKRFYENKLWNIKFPVRVITELGGKNAVIVTANAELDETVSGILYSAFAHAGQKCSAASRILVDNSVKDRLIERLKEAVADMEVSEGYNFSCSVNPVISKEDKERLQRQVKEAKEEAIRVGGRVIIDRSQEDLPGYCLGPAIIEVPSQLAFDNNSYAKRELFGPVVHIVGFNDLEEALTIFNATDYALTGGIFSQSQDDIDFLSERMECGNLYVNRSITGARVGIEPFGGFKLSGTGPKAGGKVYIPAFHIHRHTVDIKAVAEENGFHDRVDLAMKSGLGPAMRVERMSLALDLFSLNFETLFKGIRGQDKRLVSKFNKWISRNALEYMTKQHSNRTIPGQLSFSDFTIQGEHAVAVMGSVVPQMNTFLQVAAATLMGTGVTIICRSKASYEWWQAALNYYQQAGFSRENINVYFPSEDAYQSILKAPLISYFILDSDESWITKTLSKIYDGEYNELRVRNIFTPYDTFNPTDFKRLCGNFVWVRAFAVNTMRHGAPLELDLDVEL
ncbi:MAG: proline dehydrogenase family protein [Bacteriovoracaceae bacterium]|nr:proline dehydrogenase family protein [Bacteriovoracaceae bacterium]